MFNTLIMHDTLVNCIVRYLCILLIHRLMRFPFFNSAWAAVRNEASH